MEKELSIPMAEAKEYLRLVNQYFGFKYHHLERYYIYNGIQQGTYELVPLPFSKKVIEDLFKYRFAFRYKDYQRALNVLWINANRNFISYDLVKKMDAEFGKLSGRGHYADLLRLALFVNQVGSDAPITISSGNCMYELDNADGWFHDILRNTHIPPTIDFDIESELTNATYIKTGSRASDEKNCVAFGVSMLFMEEGLIKRRSNDFLKLLWEYLQILGLENRVPDASKLNSLNATISRYNGRARKDNGIRNFHFPVLEEVFFK